MKHLDKIFLYFLLYFSVQIAQGNHDMFDVVADCAYPVQSIQSVRESLKQALYALQQDDIFQANLFLQDAGRKSEVRQRVSEEDRDFIEKMIEQINNLINQLEGSHKSFIIDLCSQVQSNISS